MSQTTTATAKAAITWFMIPAADLARAQRFYETILETTLKAEDFGGRPLAVFPYDQPAVGGALAEGTPSPAGTLVYLNVTGRLDRTLELVNAAGGSVATPKTELPNGIGWSAHIVDSEGNRVGLHSIS
ncbi:MAG: VOC family protein [Candidatus Eremiobacteraeota bacterium]|nr:VOC family protein [Candidatus Eremiobacteraeota bacterium]